MSRRDPRPAAAPARAARHRQPPAAKRPFPERFVVITLLVIHAALLGWGIAANSVTFDENTHLASGLAMITRGDPWIRR